MIRARFITELFQGHGPADTQTNLRLQLQSVYTKAHFHVMLLTDLSLQMSLWIFELMLLPCLDCVSMFG